jgi:hypothetical protein
LNPFAAARRIVERGRAPQQPSRRIAPETSLSNDAGRRQMARPSIGVFGALFAVGSVLAWKWVQSQETGGRRTARELSRWEDEGGKVASPSTAALNGHGAVGGTADAWHFPRS